ncbi:glycosyltransferase family 2 protein [Roseibium sediminis]|uniref:glycosyltransferase family 2 protein n=1 Tax=Roseibium sediminis TaxID=1775174 RepID=UPI001375BA14|nr:glycosyltransferase family 2 protein [Roseibium sediminis]
MNLEAPDICAVIVSYFPDREKLASLLDALYDQVQHIVVIDNGSSDAQVAWIEDAASTPGPILIRLGDNMGIARAQNVGIEQARKLGCNAVILFDHDSMPEPGMVQNLFEVLRRLAVAGKPVAAVGPRYTDTRQDNPPPFIRIEGFSVVRQRCVCEDALVEVDYLIASGCLMPMAALERTGPMRDELFIDYVDIEWGLRAKAAGLQSYGVCGARMQHELGDTPIRFGDRMIPLHSPLRHYYHFRNAVWLYRQTGYPINWRIVDGYRLLLKYGFYSLFAKPRHLHWWMMTKGIAHGLIGRLGRLS